MDECPLCKLDCTQSSYVCSVRDRSTNESGSSKDEKRGWMQVMVVDTGIGRVTGL